MATKAEQYRSNEQRTGHPAHQSRRQPRKATWSHDKAHAGNKATHALEEVTAGRPSRTSTRRSANRAKSDSAYNLTEEARQDAPQARARRAKTKGAKVRGAR
jgi:hypothetical protein